MDEFELTKRLDEIFDQGVVYHAFTDYMRDYEMIVHCTADPRTGIAPTYQRYLFRICVQATTTTTLTPAIWARSLDERLIDYETGVDLDGYVWGVKWHVLYPGARIVPNSPQAAEWAAELGIDFHEVEVETNAHKIRLVFSDLVIAKVDPGYRPLILAPPGWSDGKIPLK
jgi:hypothetical protein